jgi:aldehyde dehydrogenase (NAD+)
VLIRRGTQDLVRDVASGDIKRSRQVARRLRAGMVYLNGSRGDTATPFGGCKPSGNGHQSGQFGFEEFLKSESMFGYAA